MPLIDPVTTFMSKGDDSKKDDATKDDAKKDGDKKEATSDNVSAQDVDGGPSEEHKNEWMVKLMGKTVADDHSEVNFAKRDLPEGSRLIKPNQMVTKDWRPHRMNVHVDEENTVKNVTYG
jgi:hypothetical protein